MPRQRKKDELKAGEGWMVTFSDLMTLLLTFFVLLISMAVIDERRKLVVMGSVSGTFGAGEAHFNPLASNQERPQPVEPGVIEAPTGDLAPLKEQMYEEPPGDLNFLENPFVQVLSIGENALFTPGGHTLSDRGRDLLRRILPTLMRVKNPVLIAGHTTMELGEGVDVLTLGSDSGDDTWMLSMKRSLEVYRALSEMGIPNNMLQVEAFGMYRPRYDNSTAQGRNENRRVDLVLDKRNELWIRQLELERRSAILRERFSRHGNFIFEFELPPSLEAPGR